MNNDPENTNESCWTSIGVWGNAGNSGRCPKLAEMIHCHNCPVFIDAGGNLLDCVLPPGYIEEWTEIIAKGKESKAAKNIPIVVFRIGGETLALRSEICREIVNIRKIHKIPHRSNDVMLGVANIRGELQLCFSIRALIGDADSGKTANQVETDAKMLVIQKSGKCWVFPVEQVIGVLRCDDDETQNIPVTVSKASGTFTRKVLLHEGREIGLLDDELLLYALQSKIS